jgi:hypothetical protein
MSVLHEHRHSEISSRSIAKTEIGRHEELANPPTLEVEKMLYVGLEFSERVFSPLDALVSECVKRGGQVRFV